MSLRKRRRKSKLRNRPENIMERVFPGLHKALRSSHSHKHGTNRDNNKVVSSASPPVTVISSDSSAINATLPLSQQQQQSEHKHKQKDLNANNNNNSNTSAVTINALLDSMNNNSKPVHFSLKYLNQHRRLIIYVNIFLKTAYRTLGRDRARLLRFVDLFYPDVTFTFDKGKGPPVKAHRFMLVQQSSYFHGMFLSGYAESVSGIIHIKRYSRAVILVMLGYVYTNEVNVNEDNACDLLDLAMHYDIPLLSESVGKYLASNIVVRNWGFLYQIGCLYQCNYLKTALLYYIMDKFKAVKHTRRYRRLPQKQKDYVKSVVKSQYFANQTATGALQVLYTEMSTMISFVDASQTSTGDVSFLLSSSEKISLHRAVLAVRSPYFQELFKDMAKTQSGYAYIDANGKYVLKQRGHKPKSIALPVERKLSALSLDDMDAQSLSGLYIDTDEKQKGPILPTGLDTVLSKIQQNKANRQAAKLIIDVSEFDAAAMKSLIEYMYTDTLTESLRSLNDTQIVAKLITILPLAGTFQCLTLLHCIIDVCANNFRVIVNLGKSYQTLGFRYKHMLDRILTKRLITNATKFAETAESEWDKYLVDKLSELFDATFYALKEKECNEVESKQTQPQPKATTDSEQNKITPNQKHSSSFDERQDTITATIKLKLPFPMYGHSIRIFNKLLHQFGVVMHKLSHHTGMIFVDTTLVGPFPKIFVRNMWQRLCAKSNNNNNNQKELAAVGRLLLRRAPSE